MGNPRGGFTPTQPPDVDTAAPRWEGEIAATVQEPDVVARNEASGLYDTPHLHGHPGYVVRYDMTTGRPYHVPVGTPRNKRDLEALKHYDYDAYESPNVALDGNAPGSSDRPMYDPDTGKPSTLGQIQSDLAERYPRQTAEDMSWGANVRQNVEAKGPQHSDPNYWSGSESPMRASDERYWHSPGDPSYTPPRGS